jgi:hypothetical protein
MFQYKIIFELEQRVSKSLRDLGTRFQTVTADPDIVVVFPADIVRLTGAV